MDIVDPQQPFVYASGQVPKTYKCGGCQRHGVKLWMNYPTTTSLACADCSAREQGVDISSMQSNGVYTRDGGSPTDVIAWRIPALLRESNDGFWGFLEKNRPDAVILWWQKLPVR